MHKKSTDYVTITGRVIDLLQLTAEERQCLASIIEKYRTHPEWTDFANWWMNILARCGIDRQSSLFKVCDDLEARLGISQGKTSPPDYRHYLLALIEERYGSRYRFCKESGIDQGQLSRILSGRADFSMETLTKVLQSLGASLMIVTENELQSAADPDEASRRLELAL
jgi:transcriptional regulator with XRE-family HTH domain